MDKKWKKGAARVLAAGYGLALLAGLAGCNRGVPEAMQTQPPMATEWTDTDSAATEWTEGEPGGTPSMRPAAAEARVSREDAKQAALSRAGLLEAQFAEEKLEQEDGRPVYDLAFVAGGQYYEAEVDANEGTVLKFSQRPVVRLPESGVPGDLIDAARAQSIALEDAGKGEGLFTQVSLEREDGGYVYDVVFVAEGMEFSYEIDARTGNVIERESEPV